MPADDFSLSDNDLVRVRDALESYTVDAVVEAIGDEGQASLGRNHSVAAERKLGTRDDPLATLTRLFVLQQAVPERLVRRALPVQALLESGILERDGDTWRAAVDIRPYGSPDDGADGWLISDHAATLDTARGAPRPDHVLGVSPASTTLAQPRSVTLSHVRSTSAPAAASSRCTWRSTPRRSSRPTSTPAHFGPPISAFGSAA